MKKSTRKKMSESAKRRCTPEWRKRISDLYSTKLPEKEVRKMYADGMTQTEIANFFSVSQKVVWRFMKKHGIKARVAAKRNQKGETNHMWKGKNASYKAFHQRVYNLYGKPKNCEICGTKEKNKIYEWANLTGDYDNPKDYKRMCKSCHSKHDKIHKNFSGGGA